MMNQKLSKWLSEALGTFGLVFFGCGAVVLSQLFPGTIPPFLVPGIFGLVVMALVYSLGHISGAHINPAVTLAFAVVGKFPKKEIPLYWSGQFLGAIVAVLFIQMIFPGTTSFGETLPRFSLGSALVLEIILTFFLMLIVTSVATDSRAVGVMAGAAIGITVAFCGWVGGPISGASMNPARSFGPALFSGTMDIFWIYFAGPCIGAVLGAAAYNLIRCVPEKLDQARPKNKQTAGCC